MNKQKLRSVMALHGDTQRTLADALSLSENRLSAKINEFRGADFSQTEIAVIKERYKLSAKDVDEIFFDL